jgi:hypothetical protein
MWIAKELANSFSLAMGKHRRELRNEITHGAMMLTVDILPSDDVDEMRRRCVRSGRMLADEAKRKGLRAFSEIPMCGDGAMTVRVTSRDPAVAIRLTEQFSALVGGSVYTADMLGSRYLGL